MGVHSIYSSNKCTTERAYGSGRWCELSETFKLIGLKPPRLNKQSTHTPPPLRREGGGRVNALITRFVKVKLEYTDIWK